MGPTERYATQSEVKDILDQAAAAKFGGVDRHDLPGGPIPTDGERALPAEKIDKSRAETIQLSYKLEELAKEFFLFTFAPVYAVTGFEHDIVYQYGSALRLDRVPKVLQYQSPLPLFAGEGDWVFKLQGLPRESGDLFNKFILNMVISDSTKIPRAYWRVNDLDVTLYTPGSVSSGVNIKVYAPTGMDYRIGVYTAVDGTVQFCRLAAEDWVVGEAQRYFLAM